MTGELFSASWANYLFQATVCIAAGLVGSFLLRRRSARAHQVLLLAMIVALAVPIMSMIVRYYELGMFVSRPAVTEWHEPAPLLSNYYIISTPLAVEEKPYAPPIDTEYSLSATPAVAGPTKAELPLTSILMWSWIVVSTFMACRLFITFLLGIRLLRRAPAVSCQKLRKALCAAKDKLGINKPVEVYASKRVSSPVIWCWSRRPALLVPADAEEFDDDVDWVGMFCHELAHYRRLDHISGLLAELMVCLFPWHLLVWWARKRLAGLSEQACDDWVVASGRSAADYAESLLDLSPQGQLALLPAVVGRKKGLQNRVRRIIKDKCGNPRIGVQWALAVSLVAACITIGVAFAQTRPAEAEQVTKADTDDVTEVEDEVWHTAKKQLIAEQQQLEQQQLEHQQLVQLGRNLQIEKRTQIRDELQEQADRIRLKIMKAQNDRGKSAKSSG